MYKPPIGWCAVLTSLENDIQDHRLHDAADPEHSGCEGGAAGCDASRRRTEALYRFALRECTGSGERQAAEAVRP